jgi:hypothetical protein
VITLKLAGAVIELHPSGLTVTRYGDRFVEAWPQDDAAYRSRALELGYGTDTARMSREHEIVHSLLAKWLGLPHSPTLWAISRRDVDPNWNLEEAAVLAVQAFAISQGIDLVKLAQ